MNNAELAIKFVERTGLPVFPVRTKTGNGYQAKAPHIAAPYDNSTRDPKQIREWFSKFNCAFATHPGRGGYAVIDLDTHGGKNGESTFSSWDMDTGTFTPPTMRVRTPSGGLHLWFKDSRLEGGKDAWLDGVDVHGGPGTEGRYVLLPGQSIAAGSYSIEDSHPVAELPEAIATAVNAARGKKRNAVVGIKNCAPAGSLDFSSVLEEIATMKPVPKGKRDTTLFAMCAEWKERGFTPGVFVSLMHLMCDTGKIEHAEDFSDADFSRIAQSAWKKDSAVFGANSIDAMLSKDDDTFDWADIMEMELPPTEFLVEGLIPAGKLGFLGGSAKSGKTYLCLQLTHALITGTPFLGFDVPKKRRVLYLYLEGNLAQVQERGKELYDAIKTRGAAMRLRHPPLTEAGRESLRRSIEKCSADLVIVDTWQKLRVDSGSKTANAYQREYRELTELINEVCLVTGASVLLVHHLKQDDGKGRDIDPLSRLNGSSALSAASAFALILDRKRGDDVADFVAHGHDFRDFSAELVKDHRMMWSISSDSPDSPVLEAATEMQRKLVEVLRDAPPEGLNAREVWERDMTLKYDAVQKQLNRWAKQGKIRLEKKRYKLFESGFIER